jgi:hypothetical protein
LQSIQIWSQLKENGKVVIHLGVFENLK